MILKIFTVYDAKVEAYLQPFFVRSAGEAIRAFQDTINDPQSKMHHHPEDYTLFEIGDFDDGTANYVPQLTPKSFGKALEYHKGYVGKPTENLV